MADSALVYKAQGSSEDPSSELGALRDPPPADMDASRPATRSPPGRVKWHSPAKAVFLNGRTLLTVLGMIIAIILTIFSTSGIVTFQGQVVKWKILVFSLELEAAVLVIIYDSLALVLDYLLVYQGMTRSQISHAMSHTISLHQVKGRTYKMLLLVIFLIGSIISPLLLSIVLVQQESNSRNWVDAPDLSVSTNCIGGRIGNNFGATGQSYLFNASDEKYFFEPGKEHYAVYLKAGTARQVFVPKIPQIGAYSRDCNSLENINVVAARVFQVQGLLYKCEPTVEERPDSIKSFQHSFAGTSNDTFRLLEDRHESDANDTKARFNVTMAIRKGEQSTAVLTIPCSVSAATATLDVEMTDSGVMGLSIVNNDVSEISERLPDRVIGIDNNSLDLALENSIGRRGIGIVEKYVATNIAPWDGLIRAVVAAYGIRSALQTTFADRDDKRDAVNLRKLPTNDVETQDLRVVALWIPVALSIITRLLTWRFPSIFSGGLDQLLSWMGLEENGKAGGRYYQEEAIEDTTEPVQHLHLDVVEDGTSRVGLRKGRDEKIGFGSYRCIRRLTSKGPVAGMAVQQGDGVP